MYDSDPALKSIKSSATDVLHVLSNNCIKNLCNAIYLICLKFMAAANFIFTNCCIIGQHNMFIGKCCPFPQAYAYVCP